MGSTRPLRVLVVEDAVGMRKLIGTMVKGLGYEDVLEAQHGGEAWAILRTQSIDLLLTDWNMPIMSGLELVRKVRQAPVYDYLPIIMLTARAEKADVISAVKGGVDGYIAKPFTVRQLETKLRSVVGQRQHNQIQQILGAKDPLDRQETHPLILFGEEACKSEHLEKDDQRDVVRFLAAAATSLKVLKSRYPTVRIGYGLEANSNTITKRLRALGNRIKLLVLSTRVPGGGVTLARLASIHSRTGMKVVVLCDSINELSSKERFGLDRLGIYLIERRKLQVEDLEQLFNEFVFIPAYQEKDEEVPRPQEIRRRLENDIQNMVKLPVLPLVYHRIVALDRDRDSDIQEWIKAINLDPLCQAQVLRRARTPVYGFRGDLSEVGKAVLLMGKHAIKQLVVCGALQRSFEGADATQTLVEDFWLHSVATAVAARILSCPQDPVRQSPDQRRELEELALSAEASAYLRQLNLSDRLRLGAGQDPFVAGMMHDIGKMALAHAYPGLLPLLIEHLAEQGWDTTMLAAEEAVAGGANHTWVGSLLAASWQLGEEVTRVIETHHAPAGDDRFTQMVALASFLAGGIYPYPLRSAFPLVRLLPGLTAARPLDPTGTATAPPGGTAGKALGSFLPPGLIESLAVELDELIGLAGLLAPAVCRYTENMRKSLGHSRG